MATIIDPRFAYIRLDGKKPVDSDWTRAPRADVDLVRSWQADGFNLGVRTGKISGVFVLDVDTKHDGPAHLEALQAEHGILPDTYTVRTGSGGLHFYFRLPDFEVRNDQSGFIAPGVDIRGEGGQVVAPGSVHPDTGQEYAIINDAKIAQAPEWLLAALRGREEARQERQAMPKVEPAPKAEVILPERHNMAREELNHLVALLDALVALPEGATMPIFGKDRGWEHNDGLFLLACHMVEVARWPHTSITVEDVAKVWGQRAPREFAAKKWAAALDSAGHTWPFGDEQVEMAEAWAFLTEGVESRPFGEAPSTAPDPVFQSQYGVSKYGPVAQPRAPKPLRIFEDDEIDVVRPEPFLVDHTIPFGGVGILYGDSMTKKTFLAIDLCASISSGKEDWHGRKIRRQTGGTLLIAGEGGSGMGKRRRGWVQEHGLRAGLTFVAGMPGVGTPEFALLLDLVAERKFDLVVVDTLRKFAGPLNLNQPHEAGIPMDAMQALSEASGGTVMAIHHIGKTDKSTMGGARQMFSDVDFVLRADNTGQTLELQAEKFKDADTGKARIDLAITEVELDGEIDHEGRPVTTLVLRDAEPTKPVVNIFESHGIHEVVYSVIREAERTETLPSQSYVRTATKEIAGRFHKDWSRNEIDAAVGNLKDAGLVHVEEPEKKGVAVKYSIAGPWPTTAAEHPDHQVRIDALFGGAA